MKIGIDIDNVISNFNEKLFLEYIKHDKDLRNTGIINENAEYIRKGMFDWNDEEENSFYKDNIERIAKELDVIDGARQYINKLKQDGNEIYIITGRDNGEYSEPYKMTELWLKNNDVYYDKLLFTNAYKHDKHKVCIENNIDIMIDDSKTMCENCKKNGVNVLLMDTPYNKDSNLERVYSWKDIYNYITYLRNKINIILDTDTYNECDDQFALSYLIKSKEIFNINAITVAPYSHKTRNVTVKEGQELSYNEIIKICNWLKFDITNKVFKGSMDYLQNGYKEENPAVNKIIDIALKNKKTYIIAIGAITNIALALIKEPKITNKIEIIWLGGNEINYKDNLEYNFRQDIKAVKTVLNSKVKMTILPCKNVVTNLRITIDELQNNLKKNELNTYLMDKFYNDGYHGIQRNRVIWDISAVAYLINKDWFEVSSISCPIINEDSSYSQTNSEYKINFVTKLDRNKIYKDLFDKLGRNE